MMDSLSSTEVRAPQPKIFFQKKKVSIFQGQMLSEGISQGEISLSPLNKKPPILATKNLHQEDFAQFKNVVGIIIKNTGTTAPGVLLARSLGLPVMGMEATDFAKMIAGKNLRPGTTVTLDGRRGRIIIGPATVTSTLLPLSSHRQILTFVGSVQKALDTSKNGSGLAIRS